MSYFFFFQQYESMHNRMKLAYENWQIWCFKSNQWNVVVLHDYESFFSGKEQSLKDLTSHLWF
jgi:hypothetical protein